MPGAGRRKVVAQRRLLAPSPDEKRRLEEWRGQIAHNIPQPDTGFRAMMRHHYTRMARLSLNRVGATVGWGTSPPDPLSIAMERGSDLR
jgi:hypothetical protein